MYKFNVSYCISYIITENMVVQQARPEAQSKSLKKSAKQVGIHLFLSIKKELNLVRVLLSKVHTPYV